MHEVERAFHARKRVVGNDEVHVRQAGGIAIAARLGEHAFRDIDADDVFGDARERDDQPADAAAEVEHAARREVRRDVPAQHGEHLVHVAAAGVEELRLRFIGEVARAELVVGEDAEVGVLSAPFLPGLVGAHGAIVPGPSR